MDTNEKVEDNTVPVRMDSDYIYYSKYLKLLTRCEEYKLQNERLINHIYKVKQFISKYKKQRR